MFKQYKQKFFSRAIYFAGGPEAGKVEAPKAPEVGKDGSDLKTPEARAQLYAKAEAMIAELRAKVEAGKAANGGKVDIALQTKADSLQRAVDAAKSEEEEVRKGGFDQYSAKVAAARVSDRLSWILHPEKPKGPSKSAAEVSKLTAQLEAEGAKAMAGLKVDSPAVAKMDEPKPAGTGPKIEGSFEGNGPQIPVTPKPKPKIETDFV